MIIANKYKNLNPKYIELYSTNPPNNAPNIFEDKATEEELSFLSSDEKARPEKKIGIVNKIIAKESSAQPIIRYINKIMSIMTVLENGRVPIQVPIASGTALNTKKLLNSIAPIKMVKIIADVLTVFIKQSMNMGHVIVRASNASARAPVAPIPAASSGENVPV